MIHDLYDETWLNRFDHATGSDKAIQLEEFHSFEKLIQLHEQQIYGHKNGPAVDVGSCTGRYANWAMLHEYDPVTAVDISEASIRFINRRFGTKLRTICSTGIGYFINKVVNDVELITVMFGTLNHMEYNEILGLFSAFSKSITYTGCIIISQWTRYSCCFSLYDSGTQKLLESRYCAEVGDPSFLSKYGLKLFGVVKSPSLEIVGLCPIAK